MLSQHHLKAAKSLLPMSLKSFQKSSYFKKTNVVGDKDCPADILEWAVRYDKNEYIRSLAAGHGNCPGEALVYVSTEDRSISVRFAALGNPNFPPDELLGPWLKYWGMWTSIPEHPLTLRYVGPGWAGYA